MAILQPIIAAGPDDALLDGVAWDGGANPLQIGKGLSNSLSQYMRWRMNIPNRSKVAAGAVIKLTPTSGTSGTTVNTDIGLTDSDNVPSFTSDQSGLGVDGAVVAWDAIGSWTFNTVDANSTTPDITSLIQRWLDRAGTVYGNYMGIQINNDDSSMNAFRKCYAYEGSVGKAAQLDFTHQPLLYFQTNLRGVMRGALC